MVDRKMAKTLLPPLPLRGEWSTVHIGPGFVVGASFVGRVSDACLGARCVCVCVCVVVRTGGARTDAMRCDAMRGQDSSELS